MANRKGASDNREMMQAIDLLAKAMPDGQLISVMGPVVFLGAAAEHIRELEAAVGILREALAHAIGHIEGCRDCINAGCADDEDDVRQERELVDKLRALAAAAVPRKEPTR